MSKTTDVSVMNCGSVVRFFLLTDSAKEWVEENVYAEPYMRSSEHVDCESRYAGDIIQGMNNAGLVLGDGIFWT